MVKQNGNPYAPFLLISDDICDCIILTDSAMTARTNIFNEFCEDRWTGNGYDWTSVVQLLVRKKFSHYEKQLSYDPEAGMFFIRGPLEILKVIASELKMVYEDESYLRDLISQAVCTN